VRKSKSFIAILLAMAMIFSLLPLTVFADADADAVVAELKVNNVLGIIKTVRVNSISEDIGAASIKLSDNLGTERAGAIGEALNIDSAEDLIVLYILDDEDEIVAYGEIDFSGILSPEEITIPLVLTDENGNGNGEEPVVPGDAPIIGVTRVAADPVELQVGEISEFTLTFYDSKGKAFDPDGSFEIYIRSSRAAERIAALAGNDQKGTFIANDTLAAGKGTKVTVTSLENGQLTFGIESAFSGKATISFWDDEAGEDDSNKFAEEVLTFTPSKMDKGKSTFEASPDLMQIFKELTLTATVNNEKGVPVEDETVTFQKSFEGGVWTTIATKDTNAIGIATVKTTESEAGDYEYRARVGKDTIGEVCEVKWTGTAPTQIEAVTSDGSIAIDLEQSIKFVVKDAFDNAVSGEKVKLELASRPSGATSFSSKEETTDADGEVAYKFIPSRSGDYKVKATVVGTGLTAFVNLEAAPFGEVERVRLRMQSKRVSIKSFDSGSADVGEGNSMRMRVDLFDENDVRNIVDEEDIRLSTSDAALATVDGLTVNANGKERRGVVTITATHLDSGKSASIDLPVVGAPASIDYEVDISNYTADVALQLIDADGNTTWARDSSDTGLSVIAPDLVVSQRKSFKKMEGKASFRAVAEDAGTYTVTVVADNGLATTFDIDYADVKEPEKAKTVTMFIGSKGYVADGKPGEMDVAPFIEDGRTFVPFRFIGEAFGAELDWDPKDAAVEKVFLTYDDIEVTVTIGDYTIEVVKDGETEAVVSDVAAFIEDGRTFLPLRVVGEILGAEFDWGPKDADTEWVSFNQ